MVTKLLLRAILGLLVVSTVFAQDKKDDKKTDLFDLTSPDRSGVTLSQPTGVALESTVNPEEYYVGPSDMIAVNFWMSPPQSYALTVTPEGTLIIPTVGEIMISELTLAKAKEKILSESRKKYLNVLITATLVKPRPVVINVTGQVVNQGLYTLNASDRAGKAIEEANRPGRAQDM